MDWRIKSGNDDLGWLRKKSNKPKWRKPLIGWNDFIISANQERSARAELKIRTA
jgi:hypothetical protein